MSQLQTFIYLFSVLIHQLHPLHDGIKAFQVVGADGSRSMKLRTHALKATVHIDACLVEHGRLNGDTLVWMDVYGSLGRMANWVIL